MIDASSAKPLCVSGGGGGGPYLMVPVSQLNEVRSLLDAHAIRYWVDPVAVSLDDQPEITAINFGRGADPEAIQEILDSTR